jgi:hypothetical protein
MKSADTSADFSSPSSPSNASQKRKRVHNPQDTLAINEERDKDDRRGNNDERGKDVEGGKDCMEEGPTQVLVLQDDELREAALRGGGE